MTSRSPTDTTICLAWWGPGSASKVAAITNTSARHVRYVWEHDPALRLWRKILPRPPGGFDPMHIFQGPLRPSDARIIKLLQDAQARSLTIDARAA